MQERPADNMELIKRVLDNDYIEFHLEKLVVDEDSDDTLSKVILKMSDAQGHKIQAEGEGVGLVDAAFHALLSRYEAEYQSLKSLRLASFDASANVETKRKKVGVDSMTRVTLGVHNSEGKLFSFSDESRSIARSSVRTVLAAVEYFVNAERAFVTLHKARLDAKQRRRDDLVTRYTRELAEVVRSTSFAEVIENMKRDM